MSTTSIYQPQFSTIQPPLQECSDSWIWCLTSESTSTPRTPLQKEKCDPEFQEDDELHPRRGDPHQGRHPRTEQQAETFRLLGNLPGVDTCISALEPADEEGEGEGDLRY